MTEAHETVIVGGGQAALALSCHLGRLGREHVILERGRLAERWRSERWDSLAFQFPSWSIRLPGYAYETDDPEGFAPRDAVVGFLERYRDRIAAPVRTGVTVRALRGTPGPRPGTTRFLLDTDAATFAAASVVVATGPYQEPARPAAAAALPRDLFQAHSSRYRNPAGLPPGGVLVVGSGASGCQIAEDLAAAGRRVHLCVGRHRRMPRRYRGRDVFWWLERMGGLDQTIDERGAWRPNPLVTGAGGGHDIDLRAYAAEGMTLLGHLRGASGSVIALGDDLEAELARGDEAHAAFTRAVDEHVARTGLEAPAAASLTAAAPAPAAPSAPSALDLRAAGITSVIWATGFRYDFGWIHLPVFDGAGEPRHRRGVTSCPGLYFLGLPWLWKLKSSVLCGVGEDALHVAEDIAARI